MIFTLLFEGGGGKGIGEMSVQSIGVFYGEIEKDFCQNIFFNILKK